MTTSTTNTSEESTTHAWENANVPLHEVIEFASPRGGTLPAIEDDDDEMLGEHLSFEDASYPVSRANIIHRQFSKEKLPTTSKKDKKKKKKKKKESVNIIATPTGGDTGNTKKGYMYDDNGQLPSTRENSSKTTTQPDDDRSEASLTSIDFLKDPIDEMTWGRRIALKYQYSKWYNPHVADAKSRLELDDKDEDDEEAIMEKYQAPSLQKAWAYFEHVVLTRYIVQPHNHDPKTMSIWQRIRHSFRNYNEDFERAQVGEKYRETRLYDAITTPHLQLGDFGLGFGLYFSTLRAIGYILFIAGLLSIFNLYYFASEDYAISDLSNILLLGSAICTQTEYVPCVDCFCDDDVQGWSRGNRCVNVTTDDPENPLLTFIVKNKCLEDEQGYLFAMGLVAYVSMVWLLFAIQGGLDYYLEDQTVKFDEDEQTAQDYSIVITNPPPKATSPEAWRKYFEETFEGVKVAAVTCAVNNDLLVRALVRRRKVLRWMELQLEPGTPMDIDNLALIAAIESRDGYGLIERLIGLVQPRIPQLLSRLVSLNTSIKGLAQLSYPCTNVFVTFEKEEDQRKVLSKLTVGNLHVWRNNAKALPDEKYLFQGKVLNVEESVEPNTVRWEDLNVEMSERVHQMFMTNMVAFAAIVVVAIIVNFADRFHPLGAAFAIAGFNVGFPEAAKFITEYESHPTESKVQISLYLKIAAFRWINTAIVITIITPFTKTLAQDGLIPQIYAIFFAEIVTTNVIQLSDVWEHFKRHALAPRAPTQDSMNVLFQGSEIELAERYTNMTKIMFLAFWYSSIFPGALFFATVAIFVNYYTDRFSMMRTWKRSPHVSTEISTYSRHYFFSSACVFLAVMSSFYWSAFPFDNLCMDEEVEPIPSFMGSHAFDTTETGSDVEGNLHNITIDQNTTMYRFCQQDYILHLSKFPFIGGKWMSPEQYRLSQLYGWTSVGVMGYIAIKFFYRFLMWVVSLFYSDYDEVGDVQGINFHDVKNISGYIPQVRSKTFSYPLVACKCDDIKLLFDWTDPDRDHTYYDLTKDAEHVLADTKRRAKNSFSRVKHWHPKRIEYIRYKKRAIESRWQKSKSIFNSSIAGSREVLSVSDRTASTLPLGLSERPPKPMSRLLGISEHGTRGTATKRFRK